MTDFNQIKIKLKLSIGFPVANREEETFLSEHISEEEWNKLGFFEREEYLETEILAEWANGYIEKSVWVEEPKADTEEN